MTTIEDKRKAIFTNTSNPGFEGMNSIDALSGNIELKESFNIVSFKTKFNVFLITRITTPEIKKDYAKIVVETDLVNKQKQLRRCRPMG